MHLSCSVFPYILANDPQTHHITVELSALVYVPARDGDRSERELAYQ
jgi:hypothetical protein